PHTSLRSLQRPPPPPPAPPFPSTTLFRSQDLFLNSLRKSKTPVTVFLVKGVKLQGIVTWFDNFSILLRRDGQSQLVYKHGISTIMPSQSLDLEPFNTLMDRTKLKKGVLQEVFLMAVRD